MYNSQPPDILYRARHKTNTPIFDVLDSMKVGFIGEPQRGAIGSALPPSTRPSYDICFGHFYNLGCLVRSVCF